MSVVVYVENSDPNSPAKIWRGKRCHAQWLTPETIARLGGRHGAMFLADFVGDCWHIGDCTEPWAGPKATSWKF